MRSLLVISVLFCAAANANSKGSELYQRHCAQCHGVNGEPTIPSAANFNLQQGLRISSNELSARIKKGNRACPPFNGMLDDKQVHDLINYLRTMGR